MAADSFLCVLWFFSYPFGQNRKRRETKTVFFGESAARKSSLQEVCDNANEGEVTQIQKAV